MDPIQQLQRRVGVATLEEDPGQGDGRFGPRGIQLHGLAEGHLVALLREQLRLRWEQRVEEALNHRRRLRADELGDDAAVAKGLDGRDALDPEGAGERWVGVDVELHQVDLARPRRRGALQQRTELPAGGTPGSPEVDHHRDLAGAVDDRRLEAALGDVHAAGDEIGHDAPFRRRATRRPGARPRLARGAP